MVRQRVCSSAAGFACADVHARDRPARNRTHDSPKKSSPAPSQFRFSPKPLVPEIAITFQPAVEKPNYVPSQAVRFLRWTCAKAGATVRAMRVQVPPHQAGPGVAGRLRAPLRRRRAEPRDKPWSQKTCSKFFSARRKESPSATRCKTSRSRGLGSHFQQVGHRAAPAMVFWPERLDSKPRLPKPPPSPPRAPPQPHSSSSMGMETAGACEPRPAVDAHRSRSNMIRSVAPRVVHQHQFRRTLAHEIGPPRLAYVLESAKRIPSTQTQRPPACASSRKQGRIKRRAVPLVGLGIAQPKGVLPFARPAPVKADGRLPRSGALRRAACRREWATPPATVHAPPPDPPHAEPPRDLLRPRKAHLQFLRMHVDVQLLPRDLNKKRGPSG